MLNKKKKKEYAIFFMFFFDIFFYIQTFVKQLFYSRHGRYKNDKTESLPSTNYIVPLEDRLLVAIEIYTYCLGHRGEMIVIINVGYQGR